MKKPYHSLLVPVEILVTGTIPQRLTAFYQVYGPTAQGSVVVWTADEIAQAIGLTGDGRARRVQKERDRLVARGKLIKVQRGQLYTWDYAWEEVPEQTLEMLNRKTGEKFPGVYTRKSETWKVALESFPEVRVTNLPGRTSWAKKLPDLLDVRDPETVAFWTEKFPSAVDNEKCLSSFKGRNAKMQAVLFALESGLNARETYKDPSWKSRDGDVAFVLGMMGRVLGEETWKLPTPEDQADMKEGPTLVDTILYLESRKPKVEAKTIRVDAKKPKVPVGVTPFSFGPSWEEEQRQCEKNEATDDLQDYLSDSLAHLDGSQD